VHTRDEEGLILLMEEVGIEVASWRQR
jgi:hypothetical protein